MISLIACFRDFRGNEEKSDVELSELDGVELGGVALYISRATCSREYLDKASTTRAPFYRIRSSSY
jgi:hypothetical protein